MNMKKILLKYTAVVCLLIIFALYASSCYWPYIYLTGRWESEYPRMYIDFGGEWEYTGVLWNADGTTTDIYVSHLGAIFGIHDIKNNDKSIYWGTWSKKGNTLIMDLRYGGRIVMKRVGPATVDGKEYP